MPQLDVCDGAVALLSIALHICEAIARAITLLVPKFARAD